MADPTRYPNFDDDTDDDAGTDSDRGTPPRMPRWVKIPAIIIGLLVLLFIVLELTGLGGEHGPGQHNPAGNRGQEIDTDNGGGHAPPEGRHG